VEIRTLSIDQVRPAPYNPRLDLKPGDAEYDKLARVIDEFDLVEPLVWNERSGNLVGGHQRLKVLTARGDTEVQVSVVNLSEEQEKALNIALNKIGGDWDEEKLAALLAELESSGLEMSLTGFSDAEIAQLFLGTGIPEAIEEDEVPDLPEEPVTRRGDLWLLGNHRLLCGDATNPADVKRVMDGAIADIVFTDPPYGVDYVGKTKDALTIQNDNLGFEGTRSLVADALRVAIGSLAAGAPFYICSPAGDMELAFRLALIDAGLQLRQQLVWVKDQFVLGRQDYHWRHEAILYGWKQGAAHPFGGGRTQDTVWEIDRPRRSAEHSTTKPVAVVARALANSSLPGQIVLDPFLGSGTTLVAAERLGRRCFGLDVDARYCDVIVARFEALGGKAVLA